MKNIFLLLFSLCSLGCLSQTNILITDNKNEFKVGYIKNNKIKSITIEKVPTKGASKLKNESNNYEFNQKGQIISRSKSDFKRTVNTFYEYNSNDSVCKITEKTESDSIELTTQIQYNEKFAPQKLIKNKRISNGKIIDWSSYEYEYDNRGLIVSEVINYGYSDHKVFIEYRYNDLQQKIEIKKNGRIANKLYYNEFGKLSRNIIYHNALLTDSSRLELEYSKLQMPLKEKFIGNQGRIYSWHEWVYNKDNKLVEFYELKSNGKILERIVFKYSKVGNLLIEEQHLKKKKMILSVKYSYDFFVD